MIELKIALQPKQRQFLETTEKTRITFYGGAKGGGKTHALRMLLLLFAMKYPKSICKLFRRTFPELEDNHIRPLFKQYPELKQYYNESKKILSLPNVSTLQFCHCANEKDVELYQGRETHFLGIDEAGQWTESMFRTLTGSVRSSDPNIKPRIMATGNPGGIGHGWLKRLFIDRKYTPLEDPNDYGFVQAFVHDNQALMANDPDYLRNLQAEPNEALRKAYLEGDWDIFAGQYFTELRRDIHVIKSFPIPPHWNRFGAYDYGYNHPAVFGWFANDEDGNVYLYRKLIKKHSRVDQFAKELNEYEDTAKLYPIVAGHDCWTQKSTLREDALPPTVAEEFQAHGIFLKKAVIDRIQGAAHLRKYIAWKDRPNNKPRLYIFEECIDVYDVLARMIHDPDRIEDVLKVDAGENDPLSGDDAYDMVRYGMMSRPLITDPINPVLVRGTLAWHKKQNENLFDQAMEHFTQHKQETFDGEY